MIECPCGCGVKFNPVVRGNQTKFWASSSCKKRIESACRGWAMALFKQGFISPETLAAFMPCAAPVDGAKE